MIIARPLIRPKQLMCHLTVVIATLTEMHVITSGVTYISGVPRNFVRGGGGGSTNSGEDRENGDLGAVVP